MRNLAVFIGELQLDTQNKVLRGIWDRASISGDDVFLYTMNLSENALFNRGEFGAIMDADFSKFDGFVVYAESIYSDELREKLIEKIAAQNKPCVSIDCYYPDMINISSDNDSAMREIVNHLVDVHDVKVVNYIGGPLDSIDAKVRFSVTKEILGAHGVTIPEERMYHGDYYAKSGHEAVKYFEQNGVLDADVYICANDQMALGAYYALSDRGIRVPEDVLMTGYDNIYEASNHYPRLTTTDREEAKFGAKIYELLVDAIAGIDVPKETVVTSKAVFRGSCGCSNDLEFEYGNSVNVYARKKLLSARYSEMVGQHGALLTSVLSVDDICESIKEIVPEIECEGLFMCVKSEDNAINEIDLALGYNGRDYLGKQTIGSDCEAYKKLLLPKTDNKDVGRLYFINSIHYLDKYYGQLVVCDSKMPLESEFYHMFLMNIGNTFENVARYMQMMDMITKLDAMWVYDPMTHIYNRAGFFKFSDEIIHAARRTRKDLFIIFLDLDNLKRTNDECGHDQGDKMICDAVDVFRKVRGKEELLMRYGGDEFVILGMGYSDEAAQKYIAKIRKALDEYNRKSTLKYPISASIGYYIVDSMTDVPLDELIEVADQRMYEEKRVKHEARKKEC